MMKTVLTTTWTTSWFPQMKCSFVYLRCSKHCVCQAQNSITSSLRSKLNGEHWRKSLMVPYKAMTYFPSSSLSVVRVSLLCSVCLQVWYHMLPMSSLVFFVGLSPDFFFARSNVNSSPPVMVWASWSDAPWFATSQKRTRSGTNPRQQNFREVLLAKTNPVPPQKKKDFRKVWFLKRFVHQRNGKFHMIKNVEMWLELCKSPASILQWFLEWNPDFWWGGHHQGIS